MEDEEISSEKKRKVFFLTRLAPHGMEEGKRGVFRIFSMIG